MNGIARFRASILGVAVALSVTATIAHQGHGPVTLNDLARNALVIVEARVESVTSAWNDDRTQIHTTVKLAPDAFYKGDEGSASVELVLLGGAVEDDGLAIIGQAEFRRGERVVVFLRPDWKGTDRPIVLMEHGKFTVESKPGGPEMLVNATGARYVKSEVIATVRDINAAAIGGRP